MGRKTLPRQELPRRRVKAVGALAGWCEVGGGGSRHEWEGGADELPAYLSGTGEVTRFEVG
jgi:hypothetical protein